jgi:hypothetical protein
MVAVVSILFFVLRHGSRAVAALFARAWAIVPVPWPIYGAAFEWLAAIWTVSPAPSASCSRQASSSRARW